MRREDVGKWWRGDSSETKPPNWSCGLLGTQKARRSTIKTKLDWRTGAEES